MEPKLIAYNPSIIFISAGFDGHKNDPLGEINLSSDDYYWMTNRIVNIATEICQGRIVSVLEGGNVTFHSQNDSIFCSFYYFSIYRL